MRRESFLWRKWSAESKSGLRHVGLVCLDFVRVLEYWGCLKQLNFILGKNELKVERILQ